MLISEIHIRPKEIGQLDIFPLENRLKISLTGGPFMLTMLVSLVPLGHIWNKHFC